MQFNNFQRKEGGRNNSGEVFRPRLLEQEADAFKDPERRVEEDEEAESAQEMVIDQGCFIKKKADKAAFRVAMQGVNNIHQDVGNVLMNQFQGADADSDKQDGLQEFVRSNQFQPAIAQFVMSSRGQLH